MKTLLLSALLLVLTSCARFRSTQVETTDKTGVTTRTTRVSASTLFDSKSELSKYRATTTDKSQTATVGSLNQEASSTNLTSVVEAIAAGIVKGLKP